MKLLWWRRKCDKEIQQKELEHKLTEAKRDWHQVREASDQLADWVEDALGGRGVK
jgi:hypothetical protein